MHLKSKGISENALGPRTTMKKRLLGPKRPKMPLLDDAQRGGLSPALWENQDQAVPPTVLHRDQEGSPTRETEAFGVSRNQF